MTKSEFRDWIYENYNVPGNNCTLAPEMLDGILDYAEGMTGEQQNEFLSNMLPSIAKVCPQIGFESSGSVERE